MSGYMCKAYMKNKQISCFDLRSISKTSHYIHTNITKSRKKGLKSKTLGLKRFREEIHSLRYILLILLTLRHTSPFILISIRL